jgi:hypothetical protein
MSNVYIHHGGGYSSNSQVSQDGETWGTRPSFMLERRFRL